MELARREYTDWHFELGERGFHLKLGSPNVTYSTVTYALGVALYEVHEILNDDDPEPREGEQEEIEAQPVPESFEGPALSPAQTTAILSGAN